jgi:hypothetical protein
MNAVRSVVHGQHQAISELAARTASASRYNGFSTEEKIKAALKAFGGDVDSLLA